MALVSIIHFLDSSFYWKIQKRYQNIFWRFEKFMAILKRLKYFIHEYFGIPLRKIMKCQNGMDKYLLHYFFRVKMKFILKSSQI